MERAEANEKEKKMPSRKQTKKDTTYNPHGMCCFQRHAVDGVRSTKDESRAPVFHGHVNRQAGTKYYQGGPLCMTNVWEKEPDESQELLLCPIRFVFLFLYLSHRRQKKNTEKIDPAKETSVRETFHEFGGRQWCCVLVVLSVEKAACVACGPTFLSVSLATKDSVEQKLEPGVVDRRRSEKRCRSPTRKRKDQARWAKTKKEGA